MIMFLKGWKSLYQSLERKQVQVGGTNPIRELLLNLTFWNILTWLYNIQYNYNWASYQKDVRLVLTLKCYYSYLHKFRILAIGNRNNDLVDICYIDSYYNIY